MRIDKEIDKYFVMNPPQLKAVMVFEEGDILDADSLVLTGRKEGATIITRGGDEVFWLVFPDDPNRAWDHTERLLRSEVVRWNRNRKA